MENENLFNSTVNFYNINNENFIEFLSEFYGDILEIKGNDESHKKLINELFLLYNEFNEKGIDEKILKDKIDLFLESNQIIKKIDKLQNDTEDIKTETNNISSQLDNIVLSINGNKSSHVTETSDIGKWSKIAELKLNEFNTSAKLKIDYSFDNRNINVNNYDNGGYGTLYCGLCRNSNNDILTNLEIRIDKAYKSITPPFNEVYFTQENVIGVITGNAPNITFAVYIQQIETYNNFNFKSIYSKNATLYNESQLIELDKKDKIFCKAINCDDFFKTIQIKKISELSQKVRSVGAWLNFLAIGDSLSYGVDLQSSDKREFSYTTDSGTVINSTIAGKIYEETFAESISNFMRGTIEWEKLAVPGYTSKDWLKNWYNKRTSDVAFIMFGWNDVKSNSDIPNYIENMKQVFNRVLSWNIPIIAMTPPKYSQNINGAVEGARNGLKLLCKSYGIPCIETEEFHTSQPTDINWDDLHFNSLGFEIFGKRLASIFIGGAFNNIRKINNYDILTTLVTRECVSGDIYNVENSNGLGASEGGIDSNIKSCFTISTNQKLYYSFFCEFSDIFLIPSFGGSSGAQLKITLDGDARQGGVLLGNAIGINNRSYNANSSITFDVNSSIVSGEVSKNDVNKYIHITTKGWHSICLTNIGESIIRLDGILLKPYYSLS